MGDVDEMQWQRPDAATRVPNREAGIGANGGGSGLDRHGIGAMEHWSIGCSHEVAATHAGIASIGGIRWVLHFPSSPLLTTLLLVPNGPMAT